MRRYLVNTTYCIYLLEVNCLYFDESIVTISEVVQEIEHERGLGIEISIIPIQRAKIKVNDFLSSTDKELLQTAKSLNYVLVSDDKKLIKAANNNRVAVLDTPHFIHLLLMEGKWSREKALETLKRLKEFYNRTYVIEKVVKDIEGWR